MHSVFIYFTEIYTFLLRLRENIGDFCWSAFHKLCFFNYLVETHQLFREEICLDWSNLNKLPSVRVSKVLRLYPIFVFFNIFILIRWVIFNLKSWLQNFTRLQRLNNSFLEFLFEFDGFSVCVKFVFGNIVIINSLILLLL